MLSVIVTPGKSDQLAGLLAALTTAAVEGLVREVILVAAAHDPGLLDVLCDETGATIAPDLAQAVGRARSDWLMVLPPELRLRDGWVERLATHLRDGGGEAMLQGQADGLFRRAPRGVVIPRAKAQGSAQGGLQRLAGKLGRGARRLT